MKTIHQKEAEGSKFLIKPVEDIEDIAGVTAILTPYYDKDLKHTNMHYWKGNEEPIKRLTKGLCLGLKHMHDCGVAHRDIKPDNILLQNMEGDPVIIDFGLTNAAEIKAGTRSYMAPEQLRGKAGPFKCDEWWNVEGWD